MAYPLARVKVNYDDLIMVLLIGDLFWIVTEQPHLFPFEAGQLVT